MLLKNFYTYNKINKLSDNELITIIKLNPKHIIYEGHFPNNPIVPGVVSVQILNEIISEYLGIKLMTSSAKNIKFPAMINPETNPDLSVTIKYDKMQNGDYKINARIFFEETIFIKFNGIFTPFKN